MPTRKQVRTTSREDAAGYRSLFEHALEGIFRSTPEGRFVEVNPALVRMLGYASVAEVLALKLPDELYANPRQRGDLQTNYEAIGVIEGVELLWKKKSGEPIVVSLYARTLRNARGRVVGYEGMVLDITERKRMEEALRQSEARLRLLSQQLLESQETERRHLARELHDEIGQRLTALKINVHALQPLPKRTVPYLQESLRIVDLSCSKYGISPSIYGPRSLIISAW